MIGLVVLNDWRQLRHNLDHGDFAYFVGGRFGCWTLILRLILGHNGLIVRRCHHSDTRGLCTTLRTILHHEIVRVIRACDTLVRIELTVCVRAD